MVNTSVNTVKMPVTVHPLRCTRAAAVLTKGAVEATPSAVVVFPVVLTISSTMEIMTSSVAPILLSTRAGVAQGGGRKGAERGCPRIEEGVHYPTPIWTTLIKTAEVGTWHNEDLLTPSKNPVGRCVIGALAMTAALSSVIGTTVNHQHVGATSATGSGIAVRTFLRTGAKDSRMAAAAEAFVPDTPLNAKGPQASILG